jgi:hypothetical protein
MRSSFLTVAPLAALFAALLALAAGAAAQNTRPTRAFTTEFACDNGRTLLVNAHPRRPREVTHITYLGNRVEMKLLGPLAEGRYVGRDGQVEWLWSPSNRQEGRLRFDGMPDTPVTCIRKQPESKKPANR